MKDPKIKLKQIKELMGISIALSTITTILLNWGFSHWKGVRKCYLKPQDAAIRLRYAQNHISYVYRWHNIMFSDECYFMRGAGDRTSWVWGNHDDKWHPDLVKSKPTKSKITYMVWGGIWHRGRSDLVILERDQDSKKKGYTANSYIKVLKDQLPKYLINGLRFMQDNAPIHTAKKTMKWLHDNKIPVVNHPPYSPDLNPIEHIWSLIKDKLNERHPELLTQSETEEDRELFYKAIQEEWRAIPQETIDRLIESMPSRLEAVIAAEGWYTKY